MIIFPTCLYLCYAYPVIDGISIDCYLDVSCLDIIKIIVFRRCGDAAASALKDIFECNSI